MGSVTKPNNESRRRAKVLTMKIPKKLVVGFFPLFLLGACSGSDSATNSTTTTSAAKTNTNAVCSKGQIEEAVGEPAGYFICAGEWASVQPTSYIADCTDCERVWLLKWEDSAWTLKGECSQFSTLTPESICRGLSGTVSQSTEAGLMEEFPPADVGCEIWTSNKNPENIAETGCTPA